MYYIGIDLGTSSVKLLLTDENGIILKQESRDYTLQMPFSGASEQEPSDWICAIEEALPALLSGYDASQVKGIGSGGQMHGLVILDEEDKVIRPAILWNDSRTEKETEFLNETIGKNELMQETSNIAFAGFTAPKLLWVRKHEPENFSRIAKIMLPKDYINYYLTGVHATDYSDASGTLLLDVRNKCWSNGMLEICGVTAEQMPKLFESSETIGTVRRDLAGRLGLSEGVKVCAGAGDNAAAAVGTGTVGEGRCNISLGTSGTIFLSSDNYIENTCAGIHNFAHADGGYHLMGCMLSAGVCNSWFCGDIMHTDDLSAEQTVIKECCLGRNEVFFLPYLMGERSPINDTFARGTFTGLSLKTSRADMVQAVLEGVAFAIRDSFEELKAQGVSIHESTICGGGAKSEIWLKIMSNVLGIPLNIPETEQGPGYGGAILAMVTCGEYKNVSEAAQAIIRIRGTIYPDEKLKELYEERYQKFRLIYPDMKELFRKLR